MGWVNLGKSALCPEKLSPCPNNSPRQRGWIKCRCTSPPVVAGGGQTLVRPRANALQPTWQNGRSNQSDAFAAGGGVNPRPYAAWQLWPELENGILDRFNPPPRFVAQNQRPKSNGGSRAPLQSCTSINAEDGLVGWGVSISGRRGREPRPRASHRKSLAR